MVIVSPLKDSSFETAYFVLKESSDADGMGENDIIERANAIIESCSENTAGFQRSGGKKGSGGRGGISKNAAMAFLLGFVLGGGIWSLILLILL